MQRNRRDDFIEKALNEFEGLRLALLDASSIIYMQKAGFLSALSEVLSLYVLPEILEETGLKRLPVKTLPAWGDPFCSDNDTRLLLCAFSKNWPVISEDKKVLTRAREVGLPYFNALMMLNFLYFKERIGPEVHSIYFGRLLDSAWYGSSVLDQGRQIFQRISRR